MTVKTRASFLAFFLRECSLFAFELIEYRGFLYNIGGVVVAEFLPRAPFAREGKCENGIFAKRNFLCIVTPFREHGLSLPVTEN